MSIRQIKVSQEPILAGIIGQKHSMMPANAGVSIL
jgi:hypothetical protein